MVGCERCIVGVGTEYQPAWMNGVQNRQIELDTAAASDVGVYPGIDFTVVGQIDGRVAGTNKIGMSQQVQRKLVSSSLLCFPRQRAALLPKALAELAA